MNLYHCMIELKSDARALAFAALVESWMSHLKDQGVILGWRLMRRKLGLSSSNHSDFLLEIELENLAQLDQTFLALGQTDDENARRYEMLHQMIAEADVGLFRPYPDPVRRERIALI